MKKGRGQTMTHDYKRNATTTLFAGRCVADGVDLLLSSHGLIDQAQELEPLLITMPRHR